MITIGAAAPLAAGTAVAVAPAGCRAEAGVGEEAISRRDADELAACFAADVAGLFGFACVLARGDRALAEDLVQAGFEAAAGAWTMLRCLAEEQRQGWLRATVTNIAVNGSWREAAWRERLPRIEARYRKSQADTAGYDTAAGLDRYRAWLGGHVAEEQSRPEATQNQGAVARRAAPADSGAGLAAADSSTGVAAASIGGPAGLLWTVPGSASSQTRAAGAGWDAAQAVTAIYTAHYRSLVRLAVLLVGDVATAEEVAQDSFIAMHSAWRRLRDTEKALSYLRQSVVNRSRSALRHRMVADKNAPKPAPYVPSAGQDAVSLLERSAVIAALRTLPPQQREALVLKYYADLSEAQIATAMGISIGAVRNHTARAVSSLRAALDLE